MIPSTQADWVGVLWTHIEALPFHREIESLWKRWRVVIAGGAPERWPRRRPIREILCAASSLQPLRVSITSGMKTTPMD